jgi:hypothetical protein
MITTRGDCGVVFQHQALYIRQLLVEVLKPTLGLLELEITLIFLVFFNYLVLDGLQNKKKKRLCSEPHA